MKVENGAMALLRMRDLDWWKVPETWRDEARRQAAAVIEAAEQTWIVEFNSWREFPAHFKD